MSKTSRKAGIIALVLVLMLGIGGYLLLHRGEETTDDAQLEARVVGISPKVGGYVRKLNVQDNQFVKTGEVLLEIDPADYIIRRDRARATLEAAMAGHTASSRALEVTRVSAPSNLETAQSQLAAAQANWTMAANDLKRMQRLSNEARSRQQLDEAVAAEKTARASRDDAQAKLRTARTAPKTIAAAQSNTQEQGAQVKQAQADLAQAEKDLVDTKIIAPMDGHVTHRGVEAGDYVQPGEQLGALVGTELWVVANYKETQLTHMRAGDRAVISIDAFPGTKIDGKVDSFQIGTGVRFSAFPPENATGNFVKVVQRVPVKILFTGKVDETQPVGPGMSVSPIVYTRRP